MAFLQYNLLVSHHIVSYSKVSQIYSWIKADRAQSMTYKFHIILKLLFCVLVL